jgi:hypothetical protein
MDVIIGGGKYGCRAVELLRSLCRDFIVVDADPNCQARNRFSLKSSESFCSKGEYFMQGDLTKVLELVEDLNPSYIFPTAPVHIAADMAKLRFGLSPWLEIVNCILPLLPQSIVLHAGHGSIVISFNRDYHCQEHCSMPETCPTSNVKKPCTMNRLMEYACPQAFLLVSHSVAPGIGALKGSELLKFFKWAEGKEKFVVGTTCDCHGVFSAFRKV